MEERDFAGLAGVLDGDPDDRAPLVLLHGLTFGRAMWQPALARLRAIAPGRRVLALDLPGHGCSPAWPDSDIESIAGAVYRAAATAGVREPVIVGHSMAAMIATVYAASYPAAAVVNVDQWLQVDPIAALVKRLAGEIRGGGFAAVWEQFEASMHMELLPRQARQLLRASRSLRQDLVAGYWRQMLDTPTPEFAGYVGDVLAAVRGAGIPYLFIAGHEVEPGYRGWLGQMLPQARVEVWPDSGHFPHLAHPGRFAGCLASAEQRGAA